MAKALYDPQATELGGHPDEPISHFVSCHIEIQRSPAGVCAQGAVLRADDPRVVLLPDCFRALLELVEVPRKD